MGELRRAQAEGGLYERLLSRLALALEEADTATLLQRESPDELELRGLSPAELELIRAYLDQDLQWLRGWHAAAEELALIEQQPVKPPKPSRPGAKPGKAPVRLKPLFKRRQQLFCALCGAAAHWQRGTGIQACGTCGSQLFRAGKPIRPR
ncbi:MAG: hypothetical protein V4812_10405 [Pseudomonadota bacterium]